LAVAHTMVPAVSSALKRRLASTSCQMGRRPHVAAAALSHPAAAGACGRICLCPRCESRRSAAAASWRTMTSLTRSIHSLPGVTRHAALRMLGAGVLPAFPKGDHRWLLAFPSLGKCRRAEEERPGETGPAVDPVAVSALPRRVGRSVGSTSRFGRDGWPQGQPHSPPYSENVSKTPGWKIRLRRGRAMRPR
jgi:hypothetical protein